MLSMTPSRLSRSLKIKDAIFIGLSSMIGAGIFTALSPAASAAQAGLLFGLAIAACVAFFNASSSAELARLYPESGGTYIYAGKRLGKFWAWFAGWSFVVGKLASCAAVALTFGYYVSPAFAHYLAAGAVLAFTIVNYFGIKKTALASKIIVSVVLVALLSVVIAALNTKAGFQNLHPLVGGSGIYGILQSAGIWFFAFAGYSRIATLGEEIENPWRSIPTAILIALGITLLIYGAVVVSALVAIGPDQLARTNSPLLAVMQKTGWTGGEWLVKIGATFASLGVLLSLMTGVSRTIFAMAADRDLPHALSKVQKQNKTPFIAEITVGAIVVIISLLVDIRAAIGFSSFTVLLYYMVTNVSAFTLPRAERMFYKSFTVFGALGCLTLAFTLPLQSVAAGSAVVVTGVAIYAVKKLVTIS